MTSRELRQKYLDFFIKKGHKVIPSAPLVPENDPTTLFTSSGMQPMVPYLLGQKHPEGTRLVNSQPCFRAQDIEDVRNNRHTTLFEMLGNWSLGDYFKKEQLPWIFEFLIKEVSIDPNKLYVSVFAGDEKYHLPKDTESVQIWKELFSQQNVGAKEVALDSLEYAAEVGMQGGRIFYYDQKKNWWSRTGSIEAMPTGEPGGPNSEMFYEFEEIKHDPKYGKYCHPNCDCGHFLEIGNSVFMEYKKIADGSLKKLPNKNVDFGGGLERLVAVSNKDADVFKIDLFWSIIEEIEKVTNKKYTDNRSSMQIITDHLKGATFLIINGVFPSNKLQGYILRRLLRRSAIKFYQLTGDLKFVEEITTICDRILEMYDWLFSINKNSLQTKEQLHQTIVEEMKKFGSSLVKGFKEIEKLSEVNGKNAFDLYQTYGFPIEVTEELLAEKGQKIDQEEFQVEFEKHKELSRTASTGMFKGGLVDQSEVAIKYHTATHLLHAALRQILGEHVTQKGSNITSERLRFDFSHPEKLTEEQSKQVENLVNQKIQENLTVTSEVMDKKEALKLGALGLFGAKYGDKVTVYTIGGNSHPERAERVEGFPFSIEICGGPHVKNTSQLGHLNITKEESAGSGVRRIYATLI